MAEQSFDPRFDPAFQRGYVPPTQPPAQTRARTQDEPIGEPPVPGTDSEPSETITAAQSPRLPQRVNPYVVVLWVIGVVFAVGGAALLFVSFFLVYSSFAPGPSQAATLQAIYTFGSVFGVPLITVGLATIAGLIFLSAWRSWHRTEGSPS